MLVDTYAVCPCGSGKKIKFCKCKDSVGDLDKVLKMVEGGQVVPALDRLSTILSEHPDAAWALAVKGRLLISLREFDSLKENAERFTRLQPSNPLALAQRAAAQLFANEIQPATESILESLTESGRNVDSFVLDIASMLSLGLAQNGVLLTARVYATLAVMASGYEESPESGQVLRQLSGSPSINQLVKSIPEPVARPDDADWGERYDEASALLRSNKVTLAKSKFESLQRVAPGEPSILAGLLTCAIWRGAPDEQSELLEKLSECESLDFEARSKYLAMSALVKVGTPKLAVQTHSLSLDIENVDEIDLAMTAHSRFVALPAQMLDQLRTATNEIPPKAGYQIIDRDEPTSLEVLPEVDEVPETIAMAFVYGKTTDRSAYVSVLDIGQDDIETVKSLISEAAPGSTIKDEEGELMPLLIASQPQIAMIRYQAKPAEAEKLQTELASKRTPNRIASLKLPLLGDKSLIDLADDDSMLLQRTAAIKAIEQFDALTSKSPGAISEVYKLAKLKEPEVIKLTDDGIETIANEDLNRIDPSELSVESLMYVMQRSQQVSSSAALAKVCTRLLDVELTEEQLPVKLMAFNALISKSPTVEEALKLIDQAKAFSDKHDIPNPSLLLTELTLKLQTGDAEGFQGTLQQITTKHGNEPEVMAQLQQLLMSAGLIRPDGSPRMAPQGPGMGPGTPPPEAAPAAGGSELWTPDSGSPAPKSSGEGGGKLWVPGMD